MGMKDILRTMGAFRVDESSKIIVALLDSGRVAVVLLRDDLRGISGVDFEHPSLEGSIAINAAEREGKAEVDDDDNGFIDDVNVVTEYYTCLILCVGARMEFRK